MYIYIYMSRVFLLHHTFYYFLQPSFYVIFLSLKLSKCFILIIVPSILRLFVCVDYYCFIYYTTILYVYIIHNINNLLPIYIHVSVLSNLKRISFINYRILKLLCIYFFKKKFNCFDALAKRTYIFFFLCTLYKPSSNVTTNFLSWQ